MPAKKPLKTRDKETMDTFAQRLGRRIASVRAERGYDQARLAQRIGIGTSHLAKVETGKRKPSIDLLWQVATQLDVEPRELLDFREQPDEWRGNTAEAEWEQFRTLLTEASANDVRLLREIAQKLWRR